MKYITSFIAFSIVFLISCDQTEKIRIKYKEKCISSKEHQQFIIECTRAGNPMSDEEGEDLVEQCEKTASSIFVPQCSLIEECYDGNGHRVPLEQCKI